MKGFAVIGTISLMVASPAFAQTPAAPAAPAPASAPAPAPPRPFPEGSKVAYVVLQRIANESAQGRTATGRIQAVQQAKAADLAEKNKQLQSFQAKLEKEASVLSSTAAGELQKQVERLQVDIQRATQDAQAEVQELQQELQNEFQRKLMPIIDAVAKEKNLQMVFSVADAGVVWAYPGLDVTGDVIKRFDQVVASPAAPKQ